MLRILFYLSLLIIAGCGGKNKEPQLASSYQDNAILVRAVASNDLNLYHQRKHTLKFAIVQVSKMESLQKKLTSAEGLASLLNSDSEGDSQQKEKDFFVQTFFIEPGATETFTMARMAGAKSVVVVAGYYNLIPAHVVRIFAIPVFKNWKPITFWEVNRRMGRMCIYLQLGAQGIHYTDTTSKDSTRDSIK